MKKWFGDDDSIAEQLGRIVPDPRFIEVGLYFCASCRHIMIRLPEEQTPTQAEPFAFCNVCRFATRHLPLAIDFARRRYVTTR